MVAYDLQVLDPGGGDLSGRTEPLKMDVTVLKGLASFGLTRPELLGAGLSSESVDRVYRVRLSVALNIQCQLQLSWMAQGIQG